MSLVHIHLLGSVAVCSRSHARELQLIHYRGHLDENLDRAVQKARSNCHGLATESAQSWETLLGCSQTPPLYLAPKPQEPSRPTVVFEGDAAYQMYLNCVSSPNHKGANMAPLGLLYGVPYLGVE